MSNLNSATEFTSFLEKGDLQSASEMLADDFRATGPTTEITKEQFIGYLSLILSPFPDHRFNFSNFIENNQDSVSCTIQEQGTHKNLLDLNPLGIPVQLSPTGKSFSLPETTMDFTFRSGKIIAIQEKHVEGSGLKGILAQLGIALP